MLLIECIWEGAECEFGSSIRAKISLITKVLNHNAAHRFSVDIILSPLRRAGTSNTFQSAFSYFDILDVESK